MEAQWHADRTMLRRLLQTEPSWSQLTYAQAIGRSLGWVKKWTKRLRAAAPDDETVLRSQSRARNHPPPRLSPSVIEHILQIRSAPPAPLNRIPGPKTILYYLTQDPDVRQQGLRLPRSTRTIWRVLRQYGRIAQPPHHDHVPVLRPDPLTSWQLDFKDVSTVPADPDGKRQHVVEVLNTVDTGTSILVDATVRPDFTMESALAVVTDLVERVGLPERVTFDRDPRFVGAQQQQLFPSPFIRFWLCLGVAVSICPPRRPDKNAFVERYHRTFEYECLRIHRPGDLETATSVTQHFQQFYNEHRPHQGLSCQNQPPRRAYPVLPRLPRVPARVDPDQWLQAYDGLHITRRVSAGGKVTIGEQTYYVSIKLVGQSITLRLDAHNRAFVVEENGTSVHRLPMKALGSGPVPFAAFVDHLCTEARTLGAAVSLVLRQRRWG